MPVVYAYNFTVQHQLSNKVALTAAYVGNSGRNESNGISGDTYDANQILFVPGFTGDQNTLRPFDGLYGPRYNYGNTSPIDDYCNCSNSRYDSFQGTVTIKGAAGLTVQGNYTYQLAQGEGGGASSAAPANTYTFLYDRNLDYVNNGDFPLQQWVFAVNYDLPFGRGRKYGANVNKFVDAVLGGWNLGTIFTYYSGLPFYPTIDSYPGKPYNGPNNVPDKGSGSPYAADQNRNHWLVGCPSVGGTISCTAGPFLNPAPNTFGNYPINKLYGPQFVNFDASIMKVFSVTERLKFTLRMDATNALNHTNLAGPGSGLNTDVQSANPGQITNIAFSNNQGSMRRVQYSGVLTW
jgi:hypothetical protein